MMLAKKCRISATGGFRSLSTFPQINPKTGEKFAEYTGIDDALVAEKIRKANESFHQWRRIPVAERIDAMAPLAEKLRQRADELAQLVCQEMGKPVAQGKAEVLKCAHLVDWYAENGTAFMKEVEYPPLPGFSRSFVTFQPIGVILSIQPWNFPVWQVIRCCVPTLMAGNAVLLKHAPNCFGTATICEEVMQSIPGIPRDLFQSLIIGVPQVGGILEHEHVRGVALTGSEAAGKAVAAKAGSLLKKAVVELGGSDAYTVLADANLDLAADSVVNARILNSGQVCIAPKRAIVHKSVKKEFEEKVVERIGKAKYGIDFGPLVHAKARAEVAAQVQESQSQGAKLLAGGVDAKVPEDDTGGAFFAPTVITDVKPGMTAFDQEIFGPVVAITEAESENHALELANASRFGLGGAVFTSDAKKGEQIATQGMDVGMCFVNDFVRSHPSLPFGGTKSSGLGRECAHFGMHEFVNVKTVCIK